MCLRDCSNASRLSQRVKHRRVAQTSFMDEFVDFKSKVFVSVMMMN